MKTLNDKQILEGIKFNSNEKVIRFNYNDVKFHLSKFYNDYWKYAKIGDKHKNWISCDDLDFLMDKYFGNLIEIKTLQFLPNSDKKENGAINK